MPIKKTTSREFPITNLSVDASYAMQARSYSGNSYSEWSPLYRFNTNLIEEPYILISWNDIDASYLPTPDPELVENFTSTLNGDGTYTITANFEWNNTREIYLTWLKDVTQFANNQISSGYYAFYSCNSEQITGLSSLDTSNITDMQNMFEFAIYFNQNLSAWDTSNVTNMSTMFGGCYLFNQPIGAWNTSNVTNMAAMFSNARDFNQNISSWSTSNVTDMSYMFSNAYDFNQNISNWDTSNVTNMNRMFYVASSFNQNLSTWCVTNIPTAPYQFDLSASAWVLPRPVWGTCP